MYDYLCRNEMNPEDVGGDIYFEHEGRKFIFVNDDRDATFFEIDMLYLLSVPTDSADTILRIINNVNCKQKLVKLVLVNGYVNASAEIILDSSPELGDLVPRLIKLLVHAQDAFNSQFAQAV